MTIKDYCVKYGIDYENFAGEFNMNSCTVEEWVAKDSTPVYVETMLGMIDHQNVLLKIRWDEIMSYRKEISDLHDKI